jgi:hypothetical protein
MKYTDEHITLKVKVLDAQTDQKLQEKKVGLQSIFVARPGREFQVRVEASGAVFKEWTGKLAAYCYVGPFSATLSFSFVYLRTENLLTSMIACDINCL